MDYSWTVCIVRHLVRVFLMFQGFSANINSSELYTEPYKPVHRPENDINKIDIVSDDIAELSLDELTLR